MNTKTWYLYPNILYPWWNQQSSKLVWRSGDKISPLHLELPLNISSAEEVESLIQQSANTRGFENLWIVWEG